MYSIYALWSFAYKLVPIVAMSLVLCTYDLYDSVQSCEQIWGLVTIGLCVMAFVDVARYMGDTTYM